MARRRSKKEAEGIGMLVLLIMWAIVWAVKAVIDFVSKNSTKFIPERLTNRILATID